MSTIEWISFLSSLGAMCTALVALFTLFELFRQRKSSYHPDLCISKNFFELKSPKLEYDQIDFNWFYFGRKTSDLTYRPSIRVVNVGLGAAKSIRVKWVFDISSTAKKVNEIAKKAYQHFSFIEEDNSLSMRSFGKNVHRTPTMIDHVYQFEYLLPLSSDVKGTEIYFPRSYTILVCSYLSLFYKHYGSFENINVPGIKLQIAFLDIGNGKRISNHKLECNVHSDNTFRSKYKRINCF
jgi:hypothetical protein